MHVTLPSRAPSVLYAEDDDLIGETLADILRDNGLDVVLATDGVNALKAAADRRFDLLLTDLDMPRMTGDELIVRMRSGRPDLPVIVLTGNLPADNGAALVETGCGPTIMLSKPERTAVIIATIRQALAVSIRTPSKSAGFAKPPLGTSSPFGDGFQAA